MSRLGLGLAIGIAALALALPASAGSNMRSIHASVRAKCHEAVDAKHLTHAEYKAEYAKCKEDPDAYK